jgi:hypothetical protein
MNSKAEKLNGAVENCRTLLWHKGLHALTLRKAHHGTYGIAIGSPHPFNLQR